MASSGRQANSIKSSVDPLTHLGSMKFDEKPEEVNSVEHILSSTGISFKLPPDTATEADKHCKCPAGSCNWTVLKVWLLIADPKRVPQAFSSLFLVSYICCTSIKQCPR